MTNEKDKIAARKLIESIFANRGWSNGELTEAVTAFAATVREEERRAAFKEIRARVEAVNPHLTFGSANGSMMKKCILAEIEAAENRKGEG